MIRKYDCLYHRPGALLPALALSMCLGLTACTTDAAADFEAFSSQQQAVSGAALGDLGGPFSGHAPADAYEDDMSAAADVGTSCGPIVSRYPIAGPHNNGYDSNWWSWNCSTANSNSDYSGAHLGNDIFAARGTPMVAAQAGTISFSFSDSTGGNVVYIKDDCGWMHYYAHLDSVDPGLWIGKYVMAGTRLGTVGNTGSAIGTEPHLHYSVYSGSYSSGIDPHPYLYGVENGSCQSGNACSCLSGINVDGYSVPVTDTDCGHRVCGVSNELWECGTNQAWNNVGGVGSCSSACSCPGGRFKNGRVIPEHMTHCGFKVCGMDRSYYECRSGGWHNTGQSCN